MKHILKKTAIFIILLTAFSSPILTHADSAEDWYGDIDYWNDYYESDYQKYGGSYSDEIGYKYYSSDYETYAGYNATSVGYGFYLSDIETYGRYSNPLSGYAFYLEDSRNNAPDYLR